MSRARAAALDERFFTQARALKRATALSALRRLLAAARAAADAAAPAPRDFAAAQRRAGALAQAVRGALDGERVALRARIERPTARAALEVREFVRPRSWLFGEHRAEPADEEFLVELLEDAVTRALERTRAALRAALADAADRRPRAIVAAIDAARRSLRRLRPRRHRGRRRPRLLPHPAAAPAPGGRRHPRRAGRRAPDPEEALFSPLRRELTARFHAIAADIAAAEVDAEMHALIHEHGLQRPLAALDAALPGALTDDYERSGHHQRRHGQDHHAREHRRQDGGPRPATCTCGRRGGQTLRAGPGCAPPTGRYVAGCNRRGSGSTIGPNISDVTIEVELRDGQRPTRTALMPVMRHDNFTDKTGDVRLDKNLDPGRQPAPAGGKLELRHPARAARPTRRAT